jgi:hypothetical protein
VCDVCAMCVRLCAFVCVCAYVCMHIRESVMCVRVVVTQCTYVSVVCSSLHVRIRVSKQMCICVSARAYIRLSVSRVYV